jgi:ubiquitin carboxyl-terminal hydrolase 8
MLDYNNNKSLVVLKEETLKSTPDKKSIKLVPGISGLVNLGNTCYLNAILQPLAHTVPFLIYMAEQKYMASLESNIPEKDREDTTSVCIDKLFQCMWREICTISPKKIKDKIGVLSDIFAGNSQNDSQEVLGYILDSIHEETKYKVNLTYNYSENVRLFITKYQHLEKCKEKQIKDQLDISVVNMQLEQLINANRNEYTYYCAAKYWEKYVSNSYSIITDLFTGLFYTRTACNKCGNISEAFDPFVTLSIEIKTETSSSLEECLTHYSKEELLKGEDSYSCTKCKEKVEANKRIHIWEAPEVLIIHLKRFVGSGGKITRKINTEVKIPFSDLELKDNYVNFNKISGKYRLYAVTAHNGNSGGGHYIAYTKNAIDDNWYSFNDESVYLEDESLQDIFNTSAYILYYIKQKD